jgi:hypothetical protein
MIETYYIKECDCCCSLSSLNRFTQQHDLEAFVVVFFSREYN